jgi:hypothetical protein
VEENARSGAIGFPGGQSVAHLLFWVKRAFLPGADETISTKSEKSMTQVSISGSTRTVEVGRTLLYLQFKATHNTLLLIFFLNSRQGDTFLVVAGIVAPAC